MTRTKLGLLGLCAVVVGTMAMSTGSAQGATLSWLILNSPGTTATELLASLAGEIDSSHLTLLTKILKLMVSITCTNFELVNFNITGVGQIEAGGQIKYTGCAAYTGAPPLGTGLPCTVHTTGQAAGTILTNKLKGKLSLHTLTGGGSEVLAEIRPEVGSVIVVIRVLGGECALPEENPISGPSGSGAVFVKDCLNQATTHVLRHLVEQGPLTSLTTGADTVEHLETSVIGSAWVKLSGAHAGLNWAAMDTP